MNEEEEWNGLIAEDEDDVEFSYQLGRGWEWAFGPHYRLHSLAA